MTGVQTCALPISKVLETQPTAIQLRYLQTLTEIGVEKNTTIVFPLPIDIINQWTRALGGPGKTLVDTK